MKREELEKLLAATADAVPYVDPEWDVRAELLAAHWPALRELWRLAERIRWYDGVIKECDLDQLGATLDALEAVPRG